mgnify:CR=1 FL=1|jgi:hypothetical protein
MIFKLFDWALSFLPKMCQCGKVIQPSTERSRGSPKKKAKKYV